MTFFDHYDTGLPGQFFDEMFAAAGEPRSHYKVLFEQLRELTRDTFEERRRAADIQFLYLVQFSPCSSINRPCGNIQGRPLHLRTLLSRHFQDLSHFPLGPQQSFLIDGNEVGLSSHG